MSRGYTLRVIIEWIYCIVTFLHTVYRTAIERHKFVNNIGVDNTVLNIQDFPVSYSYNAPHVASWTLNLSIHYLRSIIKFILKNIFPFDFKKCIIFRMIDCVWFCCTPGKQHFSVQIFCLRSNVCKVYRKKGNQLRRQRFWFWVIILENTYSKSITISYSYIILLMIKQFP